VTTYSVKLPRSTADKIRALAESSGTRPDALIASFTAAGIDAMENKAAAQKLKEKEAVNVIRRAIRKATK